MKKSQYTYIERQLLHKSYEYHNQIYALITPIS